MQELTNREKIYIYLSFHGFSTPPRTSLGELFLLLAPEVLGLRSSEHKSPEALCFQVYGPFPLTANLLKYSALTKRTSPCLPASSFLPCLTSPNLYLCSTGCRPNTLQLFHHKTTFWPEDHLLSLFAVVCLSLVLFMLVLLGLVEATLHGPQ